MHGWGSPHQEEELNGRITELGRLRTTSLDGDFLFRESKKAQCALGLCSIVTDCKPQVHYFVHRCVFTHTDAHRETHEGGREGGRKEGKKEGR